MPTIRLRIPFTAALLLLLAGCALLNPSGERATTEDFEANLNSGATLSRILGLNRQADAQPGAGEAAASPRHKLAVVATQPALESSLQNPLAAQAAEHAFTLVGADTVRDTLAAAGCRIDRPQPCLEALATYPGIRILVLVEPAPSGDGELRGQVTLLDALLDARYAPLTVQLPAGQARPSTAALQTLADSIVAAAADRARLAPWTARAFSRDGDRWHINAGKRSGLKVGDELEVRGGGKVIRAPSGAPAAWTPGPVKGRLRIDRLAGDDIAIATLVDGQPPEPADPLLLAGEQ